MPARDLRQLTARARAVFQQVRDPELGRHVETLGHLEALDQLLQDELLRTLQRHLPLPEEPDLEGRYEYFYERSLGCTGMLKTWLNRVLAAALQHNAPTPTQQLCEQHAEPLQKLKHMIREIREGEQALQENEADARELRAFLKLGGDLTPPRDTPLKAEQATPAPSSLTQPRKGRGSSVGKRVPTRDPVGGEDQRAS